MNRQQQKKDDDDDNDNDDDRIKEHQQESTKSSTSTKSTSTTATTTTASSSANNNNNNNILKGTLLTLIFKVISFIFQQFTLRIIDPSSLGKAAIQLELLLTTVLFISREGFRLSLTRGCCKIKTTTTSSSGITSGDDKKKDDKINNNTSNTTTTNEDDDEVMMIKNWNVAWLTIPVVTIISGSTMIWHIMNSTTSQDDYDYYLAGILYCISSFIEGCGEPAQLYFLRNHLDTSKRASAESLASITKTITVVICLKYFSLNQTYPVTSFGIAQLIYSITYTSYLYQQSLIMNQNIIKLLPKLSYGFDYNTIKLVIIFTFQGIFKHLLTEGDKIVLTSMSNNYDQGTYAMGSAYGSMAARLLLQPIEENSRLLWSRLNTNNSTSSSTPTPSSSTPENEESNNNKKQQQQQQQQQLLLKQSYTTLVKMVIYLGLIFSCIAVNYTNLLLALMAGKKWSTNKEASTVLSGFCIYTAFMSINGITEAFVYATSNTTIDVTKLGMVHTITGIIFALIGPYLVTSYGTIGLIISNCIAMSIRSIYSIYYASQYFVDSTSSILKTIQSIIPHPLVLISFLFSYKATEWSFEQIRNQDMHQIIDFNNQQWIYLTIQHIGVGISCIVGIVSIAYTTETTLIKSIKSMIQGRRRSSSSSSSSK